MHEDENDFRFKLSGKAKSAHYKRFTGDFELEGFTFSGSQRESVTIEEVQL